MKVLLTGAAGFIGRWTQLELRRRGHEVICFDRHGGGMDEFFLGDVRDRNAVVEAMGLVHGWIHLAGVLGTQETILDPLPAAETNVIGGLNVLEAAARRGLPGVYIAVGNHWMENTYSISKTTTERFCRMYLKERGLPVTVVRAMNCYGPGQKLPRPYGNGPVRKIIPSFACTALSGNPIEVYGDGHQVMDMIYVSDVANALVTALDATCAAGAAPPIEAGSGIPTTVNTIAETVLRLCGSPARIEHLPMRPGEEENSIVCADGSMREVLGITPMVGLEEGLEITIKDVRERMKG